MSFDVDVIGLEALAEEDGVPTAVEVEELCALALSSGGIGDGHVAVEFVDEERIRELNREYRQIDSPTDVLSFGIDEDGPAVGPIRIVRQAHRGGFLATVVRDSAGEYDFQCQMFWLPKDEALRAAECLIDDAVKDATAVSDDGARGVDADLANQARFKKDIAKRMLAGYGVQFNGSGPEQTTTEGS